MKLLTVKHDIVFTHGDLAPRNVLVLEDGTVSGLIDWEYAGWYPEHWEYVKALYCTMSRPDKSWDEAVREVVGPGSYEEELRVDKMLSDELPPAW